MFIAGWLSISMTISLLVVVLVIVKGFPNMNIVSEPGIDYVEDIKRIKSGNNKTNKNYKERLVIFQDIENKLEEDLRYFATSKDIHFSEVHVRASKYKVFVA